MLKIILTKGLPASGKSTWAEDYCRNHNDTINICKDDLRPLFDDNRKREGKVIAERNKLTRESLQSNKNVIWSDTNLNPIHEQAAHSIATEFGAQVEIKDFTDVSLEECIKRDNARANGVGESIIRNMYYQYIKPINLIKQDESLPPCYVFDIDGTLAKMGNRSPYYWDKVDTDLPNKHVIRVLESLEGTIIIVSGRDSVCREKTENWLMENNIHYSFLYMRPEGDIRPDAEIKKEIYETYLRDKYHILGVFDDRMSVVRFWVESGLPVFNCNPLALTY